MESFLEEPPEKARRLAASRLADAERLVDASLRPPRQPRQQEREYEQDDADGDDGADDHGLPLLRERCGRTGTRSGVG